MTDSRFVDVKTNVITKETKDIIIPWGYPLEKTAIFSKPFGHVRKFEFRGRLCLFIPQYTGTCFINIY